MRGWLPLLLVALAVPGCAEERIEGWDVNAVLASLQPQVPDRYEVVHWMLLSGQGAGTEPPRQWEATFFARDAEGNGWALTVDQHGVRETDPWPAGATTGQEDCAREAGGYLEPTELRAIGMQFPVFREAALRDGARLAYLYGRDATGCTLADRVAIGDGITVLAAQEGADHWGGVTVSFSQPAGKDASIAAQGPRLWSSWRETVSRPAASLPATFEQFFDVRLAGGKLSLDVVHDGNAATRVSLVGPDGEARSAEFYNGRARLEVNGALAGTWTVRFEVEDPTLRVEKYVSVADYFVPWSAQ